jgi:phenylpyruvate tautomerase PptA (4-oxalocrotonate tautomerase family)
VPIVTVHLLDGRHPPERLAGMLAALTERYAAVGPRSDGSARPSCRTRPNTGRRVGRSASRPRGSPRWCSPTAPPISARLLAALTDVLVAQLGCERSLVRGQIVPVDAADWGIGGVPAAAARRAEIDARAGS